MSDQDIQNYMEKNLELRLKFNAYIQIKMILAPIIEYIILIDRLIYLYEQDSIIPEKKLNHYLIRIFDPLLSPRCHALVSIHEQ